MPDNLIIAKIENTKINSNIVDKFSVFRVFLRRNSRSGF